MLADGAKETTTTTGTGTVTLTAATGFPRFSDVLAVGSYVDYAIKSGNNWEWGVGKVAAGNTLERTVCSAKYDGGTYTKNPGTLVSLSGTSEVMCVAHSATLGSHSGGPSLTGTPLVVHSTTQLSGPASTSHSWAPSAANRIYMFPLVLPRGMDRVFTGARIDVITGNGTKARVGIVERGTSYTTSKLIAQTGDMSVGTAGIKTANFSSTIYLPQERYAIAIVFDGTPTLTASAGTVTDPYGYVAPGSNFPQYGSHNTGAWTTILESHFQKALDNGRTGINYPYIGLVTP